MVVDLSAHFEPEPVPARLRRLAAAAEADGVVELDVYGAGSAGLCRFETEVAEMLGKEKGLFFPTGTLAQRAALHAHQALMKVAAGRVVVHPTSHLVHHDCLRSGALQAKRARVEAAERLPQFDVQFAGELHRALSFGDVGAEGAGASAPGIRAGDVIVVELPQRMNGGRTMPWDDLTKLADAVRKAGARLHMDGARLWEVQPYYNRPLSEISGLFDSVYVSFYKGLGGLCGAMLCGSKDFVDAASDWRTRLGGSMFTLTPQWLDAKLQVREHHAGFGARFARLREIVAALSAEPLLSDFLRFEPPVPESCLVHAYVRGSPERLEAAHARATRLTGFRLWNRLRGEGYSSAAGDANSQEAGTEQYFEWNMGPANAAIATSDFLAAWTAFARELLAQP
eukprot:TRINITY_DN20620_c1_g2_i1.p1 TRINITY_DN20620_c1_g2~~TRINITY_DN20620_c1_g2_i1.p1  ORF type:complete len:423 (-),score=96.99 TRINITY_DN20620_c1_g2_i1:103-1293(-)